MKIYSAERNDVLENPQYTKWQSFAQKLPPKLRNNIKSYQFPLFLDFIKWKIIDQTRPRFFHPYGLHLFTGLPGKGKTIFLTYMLEGYRQKYGDQIYIATNYGYKNQDFSISTYQDLLEMFDKPTIIGFDEIQNEFDARDFASLDAQFRERISQSRKIKGMMILATAQKFTFVDKRLRQLTHSVTVCNTKWERLTVGTVFDPEVIERVENQSSTLVDEYYPHKKIRFIQSDYIRNLYNSYQMLEIAKNKMKRNEESAVKALQGLAKFILPEDKITKDEDIQPL